MYTVTPIGHVEGGRVAVSDDHWGAERATIVLHDSYGPEALDGIEAFSHAEIFFLFDRVPEAMVDKGARHPRGNPDWPMVGIFAQRARNRPNRIGATIVEIVGREGRRLDVVGLDAVAGTPVLDIKPVMAGFLPRSAVREPAWAAELMRSYW